MTENSASHKSDSDHERSPSRRDEEFSIFTSAVGKEPASKPGERGEPIPSPPQPCPGCGQINRAGARVCARCHAPLTPEPATGTQAAPARPPDESTEFIVPIAPPPHPASEAPTEPVIPRTERTPARRVSAQRPPRRGIHRRRVFSCLTTGFIALVLIVVSLFFLVFAVAVGGYMRIARQLPPPDELRGRAATFASTKIYDRNGMLLWEVFGPGKRTLVELEDISPYLRQATIATEDQYFYQHPGFDPIGIVRAIYQNITEGEIVSGASTIPQQLARAVLLSPEERSEQSLRRKIREAILAIEITNRYPKDTILEIYLNEIYYGNLAYGIEAAAETYFGKTARDLTLAEAALLAGLPQSPVLYDPYTNPEAAKARQSVVLNLMVEQGYITPAQAEAARREELHYKPQNYTMAAPHFVVYVQQLLEERYGAEALHRGGLQVYTTLDLDLQALAERVAREQIALLQDRHATNAALVALKPDTGEILAMLGSVDFNDPAIDGQVNVALRPRQPGSSIKPVTYVAAFERGWTPASLIWDVETEFPDGVNPPYKPKNYDDKFHGPVLLRQALACSYNVPAVQTLYAIGVPAMLEMAQRLGIQSLNRVDYGLSLTLGSGEVTLLELTGAYAVFANGGRRVPPVAILRVEDSQGQVLEEYSPPAGEQVISPQHAYLITDILSDNQARIPAFGANNVLELSRPAAAKTGTTTDWRDAWTLGYTPDLVVGVWVGNSDNTPMDHVPGSRGAGPIWHDFMEKALADTPVHEFVRPPGIVEMEICADSGARPSEVCPHRRKEIFARGQPPLGPEYDFHQLIPIDYTTGARATEFCPPELVTERYFVVYPPEGLAWAEAHGIQQPPTHTCPVHTFPAEVKLYQPLPDEVLQGVVPVVGRVWMPDFAQYFMEYGIGDNPLGWKRIGDPHRTPVEGGLLAEWDTTQVKNGIFTLRVIAYDHHGVSTEARVRVAVTNPTPTPTDTPTPTPTPTSTATPTDTPTPTTTPTSTATPTDTPTPTTTPTSTATPTAIPPPTGTPTPPPTGTPPGTPLPSPTLPAE